METKTTSKPDLSNVISDCAEMRAAAAGKVMTIPDAIIAAHWVERTPDAILEPALAKVIIRTLLAALQASPCYYKAAKLGIPSMTFLAYDRAAILPMRLWADMAEQHGCRAVKVDEMRMKATEWEQRPDAKWPD